MHFAATPIKTDHALNARQALARADGIAIPARKRRKFDHSAEAISSQALSQRLAFATEAFTHLEASYVFPSCFR